MTDHPATTAQPHSATTAQPAKSTTPPPASEAQQAQLAKSNALRAESLTAMKEREKWMPTPTQEENDKAAMGETVEKKPDGSPVEETPEQQRTKQMEAKKPAAGGYQTRASTPAA